MMTAKYRSMILDLKARERQSVSEIRMTDSLKLSLLMLVSFLSSYGSNHETIQCKLVIRTYRL